MYFASASKLVANLTHAFNLGVLADLTIIQGPGNIGAGKVAELAEVKKDQKYSLLGPTYLFTPVAIETSSALGPRWLF